MTVVGPSNREIVFADREDAGRRLAALLAPLRGERPVVLALPRGGVPVAAEVARALGAPLDVIVVRKLGLPHQPELGFGAIGEDGIRLLDSDLIRRVGLTERDIARVEAQEREELTRRVRRYRNGRAPIDIEGRTVIIVDDGLATGATARTALHIARARGARRIIVAVPVAPSKTVEELRAEADQVVSLVTPFAFRGRRPLVPQFRADIGRGSRRAAPRKRRRGRRSRPRTKPRSRSDHFLRRSRGGGTSTGAGRRPRASCSSPTVAGAADSALATWPWHEPSMSGGSGRWCSIYSPPPKLHADETSSTSSCWAADCWKQAIGPVDREKSANCPRGYFGASTGAAAALWAAGSPGNTVRAVVSRGGRPDLADTRLPFVRCPTLLIVGGADREVLELNRRGGHPSLLPEPARCGAWCHPSVRRTRGARGSRPIVRWLVREVPASNERF